MKHLTKIAAISLLFGFATTTFSHDEGHGPKLTDSGKYGGLVQPVVDLKDAKLGPKAELIYKAELVRASDGTVRVYLYNKNMLPLDLAGVDKSATGIFAAKVDGKYKTENFDLKLDGKFFKGTKPKSTAKPYNLDFQFQEKERKLLTAFDNLD